MTDVQTKRRDAFARLLAAYGLGPTDYDEGEEEDPRPYLDGELSVLPWALVTVNYTSHGEAKYFFLLFDAIGEAMERGVRFAQDDIFEELPVEVVNLDTGASFEPDYDALPWKKVA